MLGLQQMFEVTAARFHAVTQTFAPLIDSAIDDTLLQTGPLGNQAGALKMREWKMQER